MSKRQTKPNGESEYELAVETLSGDLRDAILDRLRHSSTPWWQMPEGDQRATAIEVEEIATNLVARAVHMIAAQGTSVIKARLKEAKRKGDEIEGKVVMLASDELRHEFIDAVGCPVLISVADVSAFMGERAPAQIDPDEPELPQPAA